MTQPYVPADGFDHLRADPTAYYPQVPIGNVIHVDVEWTLDETIAYLRRVAGEE